MDWQPIETAPTWQPEDGQNISLGRPEVILGWGGSGMIRLGFWSPDREGGGRWESTSPGLHIVEPTHWMPLPEPPTT